MFRQPMISKCHAPINESAKSRKPRFTTFGRDASGTTAVEFGLVALPFLMMLAAIVDVGSYYLALNALDRGLDEATRKIKTGEAQTNGITPQSLGLTVGAAQAMGFTNATEVSALKVSICKHANDAGGNIDCTKLSLQLSSSTSWASLTAGVPGCTTGVAPNLVLQPSATATDLLTTYVKGTDAYVFVTACYPWDVATFLPFVKIGTLQGGAMLLQSSSAFQSEPF